MGNGIFYDEQHEQSLRYGVFEDDGTVAYLYLTQPDRPVPVADCWIYNKVPAPRPETIREYYGRPVPAMAGYAGPQAQYTGVEPPEVRFKWSKDGEALAVVVNGVPLGFLAPAEPRYHAFSRYLAREGRWGSPWDEPAYQRIFREGDEAND